MISVPVGVGLAGRAAQSGDDVFIDDAYAGPTFSREIDLATGFRTKQVCCIVLRKPGAQRPSAVVQLINKKVPETRERPAIPATPRPRAMSRAHSPSPSLPLRRMRPRSRKPMARRCAAPCPCCCRC